LFLAGKIQHVRDSNVGAEHAGINQERCCCFASRRYSRSVGATARLFSLHPRCLQHEHPKKRGLDIHNLQELAVRGGI
jgi:hypothetical protein